MAARHWRVGGALLAALLAAPALAQGGTDGETPVTSSREVQSNGDGFGFNDTAVSLRGGLSSYTGELGAVSNAGAFLGVQADVLSRRWIGGELAYEGSYNNLAGGNKTGSLLRHDVSAMALVGPLVNGLHPYVGAGFGVTFINPSSEAESIGYFSDTLTEVPLAAGADYQLGGVVLGARATYNILGYENFGPVDSGDLFTAGLSVGGRF